VSQASTRGAVCTWLASDFCAFFCAEKVVGLIAH
jgi:hypothetical protein